MTEFSEVRSKGVGLFLYHRLGWLRGGYGVRVSMHYLPLTLFFWAKDHRNPQRKWGDVLPSADLGLRPLYLHYVGKFRTHVPLYDLDANELAISDLRCGTIYDLGNLLPTTHGRPEGVSEGYVLSMRPHFFDRLGVAFEELARRWVPLL
jgi:hypothetical protein